MKDMVRRLTKDGQVKFYDKTRAVNKVEATELMEAAIKAGYECKIGANSFGYIVFCV